MSNIEVRKSPEINRFDEIKFKGKSQIFSLDEKNDTNQDLILLYMYVLPKFPTHGIKVGMTKCHIDETFWHALKSRITDQVGELALTEDQYRRYGTEREVIHWGICLDAKNESFKDYKVHDKILSKCAGLVEKEQEWFTNVPQDELIDTFENCRDNEVVKELFNPRDEQARCVKELTNYFKAHPVGERFLLNCKMRFGKSYTTYKYCEEARPEINRILILTFVPAVEGSWEEDLRHIKKDYTFYGDEQLRRDKIDFNKPMVLFLSLQNYLGKERNSLETKSKIKKLQSVDWDLIVLDEYHFGAWNQRTQETLEKQEDFDPDYQKALRDKKSKDVIEQFKIRTRKTICLSGTPFKAIAKGEFNDENSFTYSYFDEQKNKYPNHDKEDGNWKDVVNPKYAHFPDMQIYGYNMKNLFFGMTEDVFSGNSLYGKKHFSLDKFFATKNASNPSEPCEFIYEKEVKEWLEIIKGRSPHGSLFPYSNPAMYKNIKHTLWLMPKVDSVNAMTSLLEKDEYFQRYQIINLSKPGVGCGMDARNYLDEQMTIAKNTGKLGTIAVTVNKLTLGVTVKEWSGVFVLKDLASPEQYFQSIFRIQNPFVLNDIILKTDGFVFDFNIDRAASLLLKYAEKSQDRSTTRLEIAKLIVKYLPIFVNGDMTSPISEDVFYSLAEFGDTSGIPLSRRIVDTSKTTRLLDDDVIAAMLNDDKVCEIIKHVFAHARFDKPKTQNTPHKPDDEGFDSEIAKRGRDKGYQIGKEDFKRFIDLDAKSMQSEYSARESMFIKKYCDIQDEPKRTWWINGFKGGYAAGINAPIKKMKCGAEDGKKYVARVKEKFGENIEWKKETRTKITNFLKEYLKDINNVPEEFQGPLYYRWYCDSFIAAVRKELLPKIEPEEGRRVEDADNVLKHILARLFEFLYISVYRETTFQEIFSNADPNVFLEAVGITKEDFEVLNKYHIFQEDVLNNYIHDFFVNESLGSKLDLSDEKIRKQYRNSFNWFEYGISD